MPEDKGADETIDQFDVIGLAVDGVQVKLVRGRYVEIRFRFPYDDGLFARFGRIAGLEKNAPLVSSRWTVTRKPPLPEDRDELPLFNADGAPRESVAAGEEL